MKCISYFTPDLVKSTFRQNGHTHICTYMFTYTYMHIYVCCFRNSIDKSILFNLLFFNCMRLFWLSERIEATISLLPSIKCFCGNIINPIRGLKRWLSNESLGLFRLWNFKHIALKLNYDLLLFIMMIIMIYD